MWFGWLFLIYIGLGILLLCRANSKANSIPIGDPNWLKKYDAVNSYFYSRLTILIVTALVALFVVWPIMGWPL